MTLMNYLVFLDTRAGELEKILSGVKSMLIKEFKPKKNTGQLVKPGDSLYFLRNKDECDLRVRATVRSIQFVTSGLEDLSHHLKEMQPKLQLTEEQYNYWSAKKQLLLVEFESAQKIGVIHLALDEVKDQSDWIAFEAFSVLTSRMFQ
jgi:predicted RNA-binding protein